VIKGKVFFAPPLHIEVGIFPSQIKDMTAGLAFRRGFIGMKLRKEIVGFAKPCPRGLRSSTSPHWAIGLDWE
jgi:hypothetical protein